MSGKDKVDPRIFFNLAAEGEGPRTRRAEGVRNIRSDRANLDIRRYSFSQRVVNRWNSLPDSLKEAGTVLGFKIGYDELEEGGRLGA